MEKKAILTVGPRLKEIDEFINCIENGINQFRIHLGKRNRDNITIMLNIRAAERKIGKKAYIYLDLPTNRLRINNMFDNIGKVRLKKGDFFKIVYKKDFLCEKNEIKEKIIYISGLKEHLSCIKINDLVLFKDGSYTGVVWKIFDGGMDIKCLGDVILYESESVLLLSTGVKYTIIDEYTRDFFTKIRKNRIIIDKFILSFVRTEECIVNAKKEIKKYFTFPISIIAKIETTQAVENINGIVCVSDAILVGRGDLAPQIGFEKMALIQEYLINMAKKYNKKVFVGTQFLDKTAHTAKVSVSELNDIYMAIAQNVDGIMLAGEGGGSPNSRICINVLLCMLKKYKENKEKKYMKSNKTQIMATMGPTLSTYEEAKKMILNNVIEYRIHMGLRTRNFCEYYRNVVKASNDLKQEVSVMLDLPSSRPRIVNMEEHFYEVNEQAYIYDCEYELECSEKYYNIPMPGINVLKQFVKVGHSVLFRDGHVTFKVVAVNEVGILIKCINADLSLKTGASVSFPDSDVEYNPIDEVDIDYLNKMKSCGLCPEYVAISFASNTQQILNVKNVLSKIWNDKEIKIISKIENKIGLKNIDELIDKADGIMIARGDLLLCVNPYELPRIQMQLSEKCKLKNKKLIIATEFFSQFAENGIINRSELSDVALAVRQGADSIMLARETGNSNYCFEAVGLINKIIETEWDAIQNNS